MQGVKKLVPVVVVLLGLGGCSLLKGDDETDPFAQAPPDPSFEDTVSDEDLTALSNATTLVEDSSTSPQEKPPREGESVSSREGSPFPAGSQSASGGSMTNGGSPLTSRSIETTGTGFEKPGSGEPVSVRGAGRSGTSIPEEPSSHEPIIAGGPVVPPRPHTDFGGSGAADTFSTPSSRSGETTASQHDGPTSDFEKEYGTTEPPSVSVGRGTAPGPGALRLNVSPPPTATTPPPNASGSTGFDSSLPPALRERTNRGGTASADPPPFPQVTGRDHSTQRAPAWESHAGAAARENPHQAVQLGTAASPGAGRPSSESGSSDSILLAQRNPPAVDIPSGGFRRRALTRQPEPPRRADSSRKPASPPLPDPETLKKTGIRQYKARQFDLAIQTFRRFLAAYPDKDPTEEVRWRLAQSLYESGRWGEASGEFRKLAGSPLPENRADALLKLGLIDQKRGNFQAARERWQRVVEIYPQTRAAEKARSLLSEHSP